MTTSNQQLLDRWANLLRAAAEPALGLDDPSTPFRDDLGHRRRVDNPFLAWRGRERIDPRLSAPDPRREPDVALWACLGSSPERPGDPAPVLDAHEPALGEDQGETFGGLFPQSEHTAIEVWTEIELSSLHALWWLARRRDDAALRELVRAGAAWHVERLQPDNATNHPWAIHVFVLHELAHPDSGAILYAETLLSNCMVSMGRPDLFSAHVLMDAAGAAEEARREESS